MNGYEILSYCVSIASIGIAVWQTARNANLKKYIKSDAMELHRNAGMLLRYTQECSKQLQGSNNCVAVKEAGQAEGIAQALFQRSIKNIYHHFNYSRKKVDEWVEAKKIDDHHKEAFLKYADK